jgi:ketosteroid isomerase-like protein
VTDAARNLATARRLLSLMGGMRVDEMLEHFADDAVVETPFAPGAMARRHDGKAAAADFMRAARDTFSEYTSEPTTVYAVADDPATVIAEVEGHGRVAANGRPYDQRYVIVLRFHDDGTLALWREYYDPGVVVRAFRP